jgi:L-ascorbate metabolism protein UlaG (beta-lactamase superfamily)
MRLTKFSHSCVRIEHDAGVVVIDPGTLSEREALDGVDTVLITHEHFDHLDVGKLADVLGKRPNIELYTHPDVMAKLGDLASAARPVVAGDEFVAAGLQVRVYGGLHAIIHPELPRVANVGFFLEADGGGGIYHPGDSFDVPTDARVDTLFVPVAGPWMKLSEAVEFVRQVGPRHAYAMHEAVLNETGFMVTDNNMANLVRTEYARLEPGRQVEV